MPRAREAMARMAALGACVLLFAVPGSAQDRSGAASPRGEAAVTYRAIRPWGSGTLLALRRRLGPAGLAEVLRLNRVDGAHAARLDTLIVPEGPGPFVAPAPFPDEAPALDTLPRSIVVELRVQAFAAYESGRLARWGPISSGGRGAPTIAGLYHVNWKRESHRSTIDSSWVMPWTVNIDNAAGTALHEYSLPGRPESHCCIRLLADDARWVYGWVDEWKLDGRERKVLEPGTPVFVIGAYDFDAPPPWRRLPVDPLAGSISVRGLSEALRRARAEGPEKSP